MNPLCCSNWKLVVWVQFLRFPDLNIIYKIFCIGFLALCFIIYITPLCLWTDLSCYFFFKTAESDWSSWNLRQKTALRAHWPVKGFFLHWIVEMNSFFCFLPCFFPFTSCSIHRFLPSFPQFTSSQFLFSFLPYLLHTLVPFFHVPLL